jgi:hypothetical protein
MRGSGWLWCSEESWAQKLRFADGCGAGQELELTSLAMVVIRKM